MRPNSETYARPSIDRVSLSMIWLLFRKVGSRVSTPYPSDRAAAATSKQHPRTSHNNTVSILIQSVFGTMSMTLKEQAWQSGLVLLDEAAEWDETDWPPLEGGWRFNHASVVLNHPDDKSDNHNHEGQTIVVMGGFRTVMGGFRTRQGGFDSVLLLNLADPNKQWREGTPMNRKRHGHAAVVCDGGIYVVGGYDGAPLDSIERIDTNDLLQSSMTTSNSKKTQWTPLNLRLSDHRYACCAVAVNNRYIVVMGGTYDRMGNFSFGQKLSSVDIIDVSNHTVTMGPSMDVPRLYGASAVVGHRIFVVGGQNDDQRHCSLEYLEFAKPETASTDISFSSAWTTCPDLVLSNARRSCAVVAVGSCLVVTGGSRRTMEVLDTDRNRVWNLPQLGNFYGYGSMVTVANQVAVIGGWDNPSCSTLPLMDKNSWCFRRLCEQHPKGCFHSQEGSGAQDANGTGRM